MTPKVTESRLESELFGEQERRDKLYKASVDKIKQKSRVLGSKLAVFDEKSPEGVKGSERKDRS